MVCVIGKCVSRLVHWPLHLCLFKHSANRCIDINFTFSVTASVLNRYRSIMEINIQRQPVMSSADIAYKHAVDEYPYVIISRELKGHILPVCLSVFRLHKIRRHMHSKIMIQISAYTCNRADKVSSLFFKYFPGRIKREKLSFLVIRHIIRIGSNSRCIIQCKCIRFFIKFRKILLTVVVIISVLIKLKKSLYIGITGFSRCRSMIEQVR
ncbi:unknown [Lachnospiraceae bacterium CAG:215]|nr:unknown [Lachnospiraceae bacterium CAG:215]